LLPSGTTTTYNPRVGARFLTRDPLETATDEEILAAYAEFGLPVGYARFVIHQLRGPDAEPVD
jgi:hypothetical protein